mmetsp:Transcript_20916/g.66597  ORF Transcript_20916/g.66597 Transcript_20916/m.66597 type:complete len:228 (-) Transcript_20916:228-911(-)
MMPPLPLPPPLPPSPPPSPPPSRSRGSSGGSLKKSSSSCSSAAWRESRPKRRCDPGRRTLPPVAWLVGGPKWRSPWTHSNSGLAGFWSTCSQPPRVRRSGRRLHGRNAAAPSSEVIRSSDVTPHTAAKAARTLALLRMRHMNSEHPMPWKGRMPPSTQRGQRSSSHVSGRRRSTPVPSPSSQAHSPSSACSHSATVRALENTTNPCSLRWAAAAARSFSGQNFCGCT